MKNIAKTLCAALLTLTGFGLTSCDSFLQEYSQDLAKVNSWEDLDEVLLGDAYLHTGRYYDAGNYNVGLERDSHFDILHFMSDEMYITKYPAKLLSYYDDMFPFFTWQQDTGVDNQLKYVGNDESYFNAPYSRINVCNMVISLIDEQPAPTPQDEIEKRRVKGEAYFLRALYYFFLTNLYAEPYNPATASSTKGMPLKFSEVIEDKEFERSTLAETYQKVIEDLKEAEQLLEGTTRKSIYRADQNTVRLLLSRVYLYMQDWDNAIAKAREVLAQKNALLNIGSKAIGDDCLSGSSPEVLFSMGDYLIAFYFRDDSYTSLALQISNDMLNLYSDNDYRKNRYISTTKNRGRNAFFKVNGQDESVGSYTTVGSVFTFRTPEAYLTLAEASAYNGDEATARTYLEKFLATRMSGSVSVDESGENLIELIRNERAREFLIEGHRWFDLRRYSVNTVYPWSKEIIHGYPYEDNYDYDHTDWYRLDKNDPAYTLPLPRAIRNFQVSLGNANRPSRRAFDATQVHGPDYNNLGDGNDDDDWDDDWDW